jgi:hypothetical protein
VDSTEQAATNEEKLEAAPVEAAPEKPKRTRKPKAEAVEPAESAGQAEEGGDQE